MHFHDLQAITSWIKATLIRSVVTKELQLPSVYVKTYSNALITSSAKRYGIHRQAAVNGIPLRQSA
jgi:hypothetical protein